MKRQTLFFQGEYWHKYFVYEDGTVVNRNGVELTQFQYGTEDTPHVVIEKNRSTKRIRRKPRVALLVLLAFSPREDYGNCKVIHLDGNVFNNHISNLQWEEKPVKKKRTLNPRRENRTARRPLEDVESLLADLYFTTIPIERLGQKYGMSARMAIYIKQGEYWSFATQEFLEKLEQEALEEARLLGLEDSLKNLEPSGDEVFV